ncbi:hypothetical protein H5410_002145 [Solanum commersonii]|uniref:Uncharacterized protein n=1 Tax=Solanum commersonii TaxID=4109 RepID=A0A9J6B187_SOLCO|nr:hypothetical protein H5410_002145 [Solanum commersonii]
MDQSMEIRENLWIKFFNKCKIKVGNGGRTLLREDKWVDRPSKEATIREMRDNQGWDLRFRRHLNDWEVNKIVELLNILRRCKDLNTNEDNLFWNRMSKADFQLARLIEAHKDRYSYRWMALEDDLESQDTIQDSMFHLAVSQSSYTHSTQPHEKRHANLFQVLTAKLWQIFINLRGINWTMPRNIKEALACWNRDENQSGHRERWKIVPACIWWSIWMERNQRCFKNKSCSIQNLKLNCLVLFFFWCKHEYPQDAEDTPSILEFL